MACIGEPISWLRLERFALGATDPAIASHLAACPACRHCLDEIRGDAVALPPLVVPAAPPRRSWRLAWLAPAFAAAAAAAVILVIVLRPPPSPPSPPSGDTAANRVAIKGIGEVTLELVRERAGQIQFDARRYAPGDRWKVMVSCPPGALGLAMALDISVADGLTVDHPLAASQVVCGNRVVVPGAFTVTGNRANRVCARIAPLPEVSAAAATDAGMACITLVPERR